MTGNPNPHLRRAVALEVLTVLWNVVEGVIAVGAGAISGSVALIGFGIDSFIETTSAVVVGRRFLNEIRGKGRQGDESRATRIAGYLLLALALYITVDAGRRLLGYGDQAEETTVGIILTAISLVVMPFLGRAKLKTAAVLSSSALKADAFETIACAWLSLTTLTGLLLNALLGWWWADPLAALVLVPLIVREGLEARRGGCDCHED